MKPTLNLRPSQHLALTPQLQQSIRLLQLSTAELLQEVEQMLDSNPFLERDDDSDAEAPAPAEAAELGSESVDAGEAELDVADWSRAEAEAETWDADPGPGDSWQGGADDAVDPLAQAHLGADLRQHLLAQLAGVGSDARAAAEVIIDSLDDDGYLDGDLPQLALALGAGAQQQAAVDALTLGLALVQSFDPPGVGARSLDECLRLQLQRRLPDAAAQQALALCRPDALESLAKRDWKRLGRLLPELDDAALRAAAALLARLDPRPGARFARDTAQAVVPDVLVRRTSSGWRAVVNPDVLPRLRIHSYYAELLRRSRAGPGLAGPLQEARWFVRNVQQRFDTIERVAQAVVERQQAFFDRGELGMRPLVLREIADQLGLHESTISRVTTQKFMLTPHGTFELKYFFGSALATDSGVNASSTAVRALIRQMVQQEDASAPLSDGELATRLAAAGISVARRTVAKYREALRIAPAPQRRQT